MKCLRSYQWVKLPRNCMPEGKGIMSAWAKLASRAAFRKGNASYCGHINSVIPGMWAGGIVGLKSILGSKSRKQALETMEALSERDFISYELDTKTKKLTYQMMDWVAKCSGADCMDGAVYAADGYGFLCLPRNITERLVEKNYIFDEADAWMDLWCHSVWQESNNAFSCLAPAVQYGKYGALLTLDTLGQRWGWEKTKVWRFFRKYGDVFALYRLPGSYGCIIFNKQYPAGAEVSLPPQEEILRILNEIRILGENVQKKGTDHEHMNRLITWYSRRLTGKAEGQAEEILSQNRVADSASYIRAYFSLCRNCKNCNYDCQSKESWELQKLSVDLTKIAKERFIYESG